MAQPIHKNRPPPRAGRGDNRVRGPHGSRRARHQPNHDERHLIYGLHSVHAALSNPDRQVDELYLTLNAENKLAETGDLGQLKPNRVSPKDLDKQLGSDTVHQGALAVCQPLPDIALAQLIYDAQQTGRPLLVLDQITDPQNVGAILRSAAAFGTSGLVMTRRHSPPLAGALAKAASGALENVPVCLVQNLARALAEVADNKIPIAGLDSEATAALEDALHNCPMAIVLGAENKGLRQSTREACDSIVRIAAEGPITSLNVSNAAAITLHLHAVFRAGRLRTA